MSKQSCVIDNDLFLECVEIRDDILVWKPFRKKLGLARSKNYETGKQCKIYSNKTNNNAPYIRFSVKGVCYQISYPKALMWARDGKEPQKKVWIVDGDKSNMTASNVSLEFHAWWERQGKLSSQG